MTVHLRKLAAGVDSIEELEEIQTRKLALAKQDWGREIVYTYTRNVPRRAEELFDGGSLYWVIKGQMRVRQEILALEEDVDEEGRRYCMIILRPGLVRTELKAQKPFQGWRYLNPEDAPKDLGQGGEVGDQLPEEIARELRELGLL